MDFESPGVHPGLLFAYAAIRQNRLSIEPIMKDVSQRTAERIIGHD